MKNLSSYTFKYFFIKKNILLILISTFFHEKNLSSYLRLFPEEKRKADAILHRWKTITSELSQLYTAKFKARSVPEIPTKFRSILQAMHIHYYLYFPYQE